MTDVPINNVLPLANVTATAGQTVFNYPFLIQAADQLTVIETKDPSGTPVIKTLVQGTDYGVPSGINTDGGGTITLDATTYPSGATVGDQYTLLRKIPIQRLTDFQFRGRFEAATVNTQLDTIFLILQEISRDLGRTLILPDEDPLSSIKLPSQSDRLGKVLGFDGTNGDAIAVALATTTLSVTSFIETLLDDADAATARATLGAAALAADNTLSGDQTFNAALVLGDGSELTIASGTITPTGNYHTVDTESDAASDDLNNLTLTNIPDKAIVCLRAVNAARTVVCKHNVGSTGKFLISDDADFSLDDAEKLIAFQRRGDFMEEVFRSTTGLAGASQAQMEAATATDVAVTPGIAHHHPGVAKALVTFTVTAGSPAIDESFNVSSITDNGVGDFTFNFTTAFSSVNYFVTGGGDRGSNADYGLAAKSGGRAVGSCACNTFAVSIFSISDPVTGGWAVFFGDQ